MNTFEQNFSTFDKFKSTNEAEEKPNSFINFQEDKTKKGLSDLTNILKSQKPNIPLKNKKNDCESRIHIEIANIHYEIINKIQHVLILLKSYKIYKKISVFRVIPMLYRDYCQKTAV